MRLEVLYAYFISYDGVFFFKKMDSITFTQERMKRQIESLQASPH
jgi:hypothetical protein